MTLSGDSVKKTIRDLLNLAENNAATEGEIDNAIRFARRLMDAHHLSEEQCRLDPSANAAREEIMGMETIYGDVRTLGFWEKALASFVEKLVGSVGCYHTHKQTVRQHGMIKFDANGKPDVRCGLVFYGPEEDIAIAIDLYQNLHDTIAAMSRLKYGNTLRGSGKDYSEGFIRGLHTKLDEGKKQDCISAESHTLIVRSTEIALATKKRAKNWLAQKHNIKLGKSQASYRSKTDFGAYQAGINDGKKITPEARRKDKLTGETQRRLT